MKDIPGNFEKAEYAGRADRFDKHLRTLDWKKVRGAMVVNGGRPWDGLVSVFLGVKPGFIFSDDELQAINPMDFVPTKSRDNFILAQGDGFKWFMDIKGAEAVFRNFPQYFPDVDLGRAKDASYIRRYIGKLSASFEADPLEITKTGLVLGYPIASVLSFAKDRVGTAFSHKGYYFSAVRTDVSAFKVWLDSVYSQSGMDLTIKRNEERLSKEFSKLVAQGKESISLVTVGRRKYLEVKFADIKGNFLGIQFLPLLPGKLDYDDVFAFLNDFATRYSVPETTFTLPKGKKDGTMGIYYEGFTEVALKTSSKSNVIFLQKNEYPTKYKPNIMALDRKVIIDWLNQNGKGEFIKYIK